MGPSDPCREPCRCGGGGPSSNSRSVVHPRRRGDFWSPPGAAVASARCERVVVSHRTWGKARSRGLDADHPGLVLLRLAVAVGVAVVGAGARAGACGVSRRSSTAEIGRWEGVVGTYGVHSPGWKRATAALWAWVEVHGEVASVPAGPGEEGLDLRKWVHARRFECRQGLLSGDQITQLEELPGWSWGTTHAQRWERCFAALVVVVAGGGTASVPAAMMGDGVAVGRWVSQQRAAHQAGRLPHDRSARLDALPGWRWTGRPR